MFLLEPAWGGVSRPPGTLASQPPTAPSGWPTLLAPPLYLLPSAPQLKRLGPRASLGPSMPRGHCLPGPQASSLTPAPQCRHTGTCCPPVPSPPALGSSFGSSAQPPTQAPPPRSPRARARGRRSAVRRSWADAVRAPPHHIPADVVPGLNLILEPSPSAHSL